jgi:hypothetical protein
MSAEIINEAGKVLTARITGKLTQPELARLQDAAAEAIRRQGKVRILVIAENFQGWEKGGNWEDDSFQAENDPYIEKMAIVGEKRWEDLATIFVAKGLRSFPIEFFSTADLAKARAWLTQG